MKSSLILLFVLRKQCDLIILIVKVYIDTLVLVF